MLTAMESREQYDRELLEEYSRPLDRQPAPVFVGRQDILELIQANCRGAMRALGRNQRAAGHTIVLQGAPGAGKTAILSHLEEEWDGKPDRPHVLEIRQAYLEDPATMALAIVRKLDPSKASPENIAFSLLKELLPPQDWKHPLCILVDEIQNVRESHGEVLTPLHLGTHRLPIVPIYAGLANSTDSLAQAGVSRLQTDNVRTLGPLASEEVRDCVKRMIANCRIDPGAGVLVQQLADEIARSSEGWPQHVRTEAAAAFRAIGQKKGEIKDIEILPMRALARKYRQRSYEARQSKEMKEAKDLVAAVMEEVPSNGGLSRSRVLNAIKGKIANGQGTEWELPEGMSAGQFLGHLIHRGALQPGSGDALVCPIPSLRTWLIDRPRAQGEMADSGPTDEDRLAAARWEASKVVEAMAAERPQTKDSLLDRVEQGRER